jgi:hypothetical protein
MAMWDVLALRVHFYKLTATQPESPVMRLVILSSLIVSSLIAVTGCGASSSSVRQPSNVADTSSDPSWTPPGEMNVKFTETAPAPERKSQGTHEAMTMQPNKRVIVKNALRAATY